MNEYEKMLKGDLYNPNEKELIEKRLKCRKILNKFNSSLDKKVRNYFKNLGIEDKIIEFDVSSATVELASKALNTTGGRIAKSMSFDINGTYAVIVMTGDVKVDNSKYKGTFHTKAKMLKIVGNIK